MFPASPRKTIVGGIGASPRKTLAQAPRTDSTPRKTIVGSTAQPLRKAMVGNLAASPRKTIVGSTVQPPRKTTPANLGMGSNGPTRPLAEIHPGFQNPNSTANPQFASRSRGNGDGNLDRNVAGGNAPMPAPSPGPPNAAMTWDKPQNISDILAGGMGPAAKRMGKQSPRASRAPRKGSAFYGE